MGNYKIAGGIRMDDQITKCPFCGYAVISLDDCKHIVTDKAIRIMCYDCHGVFEINTEEQNE